jgi:ribosome-binding ATPase
MKTAIIGFAGSGKTTLFSALAGPTATQSDRAMIKVPEPRLDPLIRLFAPKKVTLTEIEVQDTKGASSKGGLGEKILTEIRPFDCLLAVLDGFSGLSDPEAQRREIEADLIIADLSVIEKRLERVGVDKKKAKGLVDPKEEEFLIRARDILESDRLLRSDPSVSSAPELKGFRFLSAKPMLYAWNLDEQRFKSHVLPPDSPGEVHVTVSARLERDLAEITDPEEREMFLGDLGVNDSVLERIISRTYDLLGLITFLTAGEKEVRSWPLKRGMTAPEAAGVIHSDIQKGFIRAEVLAFDDLTACGDFKTAKERGLLRLEGKEYVVRDGDIITFRFNV